METGIGVDIVEIDRMEHILQQTPSFAMRVFTEEEREYCDKKPNCAAHYACRFAAREAVLKALGTGFSAGVGRKDVSVTRDDMGKPRVVLAGKAQQIAQELGILEIALSLSYTSTIAIANAMAITQESKPEVKRTEESQKVKIAKTFKDVRSVLDELDRCSAEELESLVGTKEQAAALEAAALASIKEAKNSGNITLDVTDNGQVSFNI